METTADILLCLGALGALVGMILGSPWIFLAGSVLLLASLMLATFLRAGESR